MQEELTQRKLSAALRLCVLVAKRRKINDHSTVNLWPAILSS